MLICFVDDPKNEARPDAPVAAEEGPRVAELEKELETARAELEDAIRNLETASEEHKVINEEALSVSEEFQSTNEELLTSKEELQSLNEELTALNTQLQETLERQRTTSDDLQNILYSTNVATLFLDASLNIRFFTPATKALFNVIASDIGRPLADLSSLAADGALLEDARTVLQSLALREREIESRDGVWFIRRILPYRAHGNRVEGVVITFVDITERKRIAGELEAAKLQAEQANAAKSRFLAAASHDLRQPLQTLALIQGLLAKKVEGEKSRSLVARLDETLGAMTGMLNSLLDINQIEAGMVVAQKIDFPVMELLARLRNEFTYHAQSQLLVFQLAPCAAIIHSDPRLLEQMLRNLISNALKHTTRGKVLLGCRRRKGALSIEVWDTGAGIPEGELQAIFEEFYQLGNSARERSRGLGLGLSIVRRLGHMLGHPIGVRSEVGKGSVFTIEVPLQPARTAPPRPAPRTMDGGKVEDVHRTGAILVIEDDPDVRGLLELLLNDEGYRVAIARDGVAALELVAQGTLRPDLILADYNLPNMLNGVEATARLREKLQRHLPVIILTGDISTETLRDIASHDCAQINKPVKARELTRLIQRLLPLPQPAAPAPVGQPAGSPDIFVVDDDSGIRQAIRDVFEEEGRAVADYADCEAFLAAYRPGGQACLLVDAYLPGMSGIELLRQLRKAGHQLPAIMITGRSDVQMAVQAMKAGASDFIEKPVDRAELIASVERALDQSRDQGRLLAARQSAASHIASLTPRQRQILDMVLAGKASKIIAADLGLSQRTVENHRAQIMMKTGAKSLPALARLALVSEDTKAVV